IGNDHHPGRILEMAWQPARSEPRRSAGDFPLRSGVGIRRWHPQPAPLRAQLPRWRARVGRDGRGGEIGGDAAVGRTGDSNLNAEEAEVLAEDTEIMHENEISKIIIGCAMKVDTEGPGLLESWHQTRR